MHCFLLEPVLQPGPEPTHHLRGLNLSLCQCDLRTPTFDGLSAANCPRMGVLGLGCMVLESPLGFKGEEMLLIQRHSGPDLLSLGG